MTGLPNVANAKMCLRRGLALKPHDWVAYVCIYTDVDAIYCLLFYFLANQHVGLMLYDLTVLICYFRCHTYNLLGFTYQKLSSAHCTRWICVPFMFDSCKLSKACLLYFSMNQLYHAHMLRFV